MCSLKFLQGIFRIPFFWDMTMHHRILRSCYPVTQHHIPEEWNPQLHIF